MHIDRQTLRLYCACALLLLSLSVSGPATAQFTMNINSLADDGLQVADDMICATAASECTFRAAIEAANNRSDIVIFEFSSDLDTDVQGRSIITPQSPLPAIRRTVIIQGQTHPEFNASQNLPRFLISGAAAGASAGGLRFEGGSEGSQVRHLAVYDFMLSGITLAGVDDITLQDNHVGLRPLLLGTAEPAGNNGSGIFVTGSNGNLIEDNWIGANGSNGISLFSGSGGNLIIGNRIGQRPVAGDFGADVAGNLGNGVHIAAGSGGGNQIGLCSGFPQETCRANVITANSGYGVALLADDQQVRANWIGATPEAPDDTNYGNGDHGIRVESSDNSIIGGLNAWQTIRHNTGIGISLSAGGNVISRNLIRGNGARGIMVDDGGQDITDNVIGEHEWGIGFSHPSNATAEGLVRILQNRIGLSQSDEPIPNNWGIVGWEGGFSRIGLPGQGNTIAFNSSGGIVFSESDTSWVQSNWIGMLPDGTPAGNNGPGVYVTVHTNGGMGGFKRIGYLAGDTIPVEHVDTPDALGNVIAHNTDGVLINSPQSSFTLLNNPVRGNRFIANSGQAINLGPGGDTIDPGGAMEGPNRLQNFPQFDPVETLFNDQTGEIEFNYVVATTTSHANYPLSVDFYIADGSSSQGRVYLYTDTYTGTFAAQPKSGSFTPPSGINPAGAWLVATATDADGNTSQFSEPVSLAELSDELFQDRFED